MIEYGILFGLATMLLFGISGFMIKNPTSRFGNIKSAFIVLIGGELPALLAAFFFLNQFNFYTVILGAISGIPIALGYILFYVSLQKRQASNTYSINILQALVIAVGGVLLLKENINLIETAGFVTGTIGVFLVTTTRHSGFDKAYLPAVAGNISWAVYWLVVGYAISNYGGLIPILFVGRGVGSIIVLPFFLLDRKSRRLVPAQKDRSLNWELLVGGIIAGAGNITFAMLVIFGFLAVGSIFNAFSLVIIILLAFVLLKERFSSTQVIGLLTVIISGVIIAVG
jgi:drug/metabolite transporter (DMT)-like permease